MKTEKYISELLYLHDCVIVPRLGGFVANYRGALISKGSNTVFPPAKKIAFNSRLIENDGLLANFIAKKEQINYNESISDLNFFVEQVFNELNEGKKVAFDNIGFLVKDDEMHLQFYPETNVNYLTDSFGLSPVHFMQLEKGEIATIEIAEEKTFVEWKSNPDKKRKKYWKYLAIIPVAAAIALMIINPDEFSFIGQRASKIWHKQSTTATADLTSSFTDSFLQQRNTDLNALNEKVRAAIGDATPKTDKSSIQIKREISTQLTEEIKQPEAIADNQTSKTTNSISVASSSENKYYIIAAQFAVPENADKFVRKLNQTGYISEIAGERKGLKLVSCFSTDNKAEAKLKLEEIKSSLEKQAWIYEK